MSELSRRLHTAFTQLLTTVRRLLLPVDKALTPQDILEFRRANLRRVNMTALLAMPIHVAVFLQFYFMTPSSADEARWRQLIMSAHALYFAVMLIFALLTSLIHWRPDTWPARALHHAMIIFILSAGLAIVGIDQYIGPNITVYILVTLLCGVMFLTPPSASFFYFSASYLLLFFILGSRQPDVSLVLSGRVNGLVGAVIGFSVSIVMWRYYVTSLAQHRLIIDQQEQLRAVNVELQKAAFLDPLTALPNRRFFDEIIRKEIGLVQRSNRESCLIILDVDHFKAVNDTYGHPAGDEALRQLADLLRTGLRDSDYLARLGGEEFIILLPCTDLTGTAQVGEKLRALIESKIFSLGSDDVRLTASFGVARLIPPKDGQSNYYTACDKALYLAKQKGRNRVEIAIPA